MKSRGGLFLIYTLILGLSFVPVVHAEEIVVSGNGAESSSQMNASTTQTTSVGQSNDATVNNTITQNANTGGNSASANSGGNTNVSTGNSSTTTDISTTANTSSTNVENCNCTQGSTTVISNNGDGSTNGVNNNSSTQTNIFITQNATITNTINGKANTGNNVGSYNNGNTSIHTGDIYVNQQLINGPINVSHVSIPGQSNKETSIVIKNNGVDSTNIVNEQVSNLNNVKSTNQANINNFINWDLNTGGNIANSNVGNVDIATGNIISETIITNIANVSDVTITCCPVNPPPGPGGGNNPPPGASENNPGTTPSSSTNPSTAIAQAANTVGSVLAATTNSLLPATGSNWLFLALIGNISMLFLGVVLRLRSGRSPGFAFAF